jgi:hypothetical protein
MRLVIASGLAVLVTVAAWGTGRYSALMVSAISSTGSTPGKVVSPAGDGLVVHEWGTFTSFSGSDGVRLEFRPLVDEDLPPFVLDRFLQSGAASPFSKSTLRVRMRMETPVTYFYTNRERDVNVRVRFPEGLLTEFYPPVAQMEPSYTLGERLSLRGSALDWGGIHLIPTDRLQAHVDDPERRRLLESLIPASLVPPTDARYHYGHARETDSALVQVHRSNPGKLPPELSRIPVGDFFEKFLFYRGVGNFDLPLKLTASSDGTFELTNSGHDPIRSLFLINVDGPTARFTAFEQIPGGGRLQLLQTGKATTVDELADAVKDALIEAGLYEKEAIAMVETWRSSWFGETGTRLLYVLPQHITEALLPLEINPQPEKTIRVLVGRMEIMTPEQETRIASLVRKSAAERQADLDRATSSGGHQPSYVGPPELSSLGRLAEPALARVGAINSDPAIRAEAHLLLQRLTGTAGR